MICRKCGSETKVVDSRTKKPFSTSVVERTRECLNGECKLRMKTTERMTRIYKKKEVAPRRKTRDLGIKEYQEKNGII